ncbi:hypothetical protein [Dehalobacter restrictus]|uniref:hypothetical protein n=1 Tax=Dehalobacter restrictus TaxID=55583 RepID=UPI00338DD98E
MQIGSNFNMYANLEVDGVVVGNLNASIDTGSVRMQMGAQVIDKEAVTNNAAEVQALVDEFITAVKSKIAEFGLPITL